MEWTGLNSDGGRGVEYDARNAPWDVELRLGVREGDEGSSSGNGLAALIQGLLCRRVVLRNLRLLLDIQSAFDITSRWRAEISGLVNLISGEQALWICLGMLTRWTLYHCYIRSFNFTRLLPTHDGNSHITAKMRYNSMVSLIQSGKVSAELWKWTWYFYIGEASHFLEHVSVKSNSFDPTIRPDGYLLL